MGDLNFNPFRNDPFSSIGRLPGFDGGSAPRSRADFRKPLPEEQFKSIGQSALDAGSSGLGYVLGTLDKPGQAARGVLAGHGATALKHLVPFSDSMGLTTPKEHVSGRDLTDQYGLTSKGDKGWGAWGAGLAADIGTDPLTYMSFGAKHALTGVGKAVQKTGALKGWSGRALLEGFHATEPGMLALGKDASDVTHAIDQGRRIASQGVVDAAPGLQAGQPLSGLVRLGIPFGPSATFGTGRRAQQVAGAMDAAGHWAKFGNPVGRAVGSLFNSHVHGAVDRITQEGAERYLDPALQALKRTARDDTFGAIQHLDPLIQAGGHSEQAITDAARSAVEHVPSQFDPALLAQVQPVARHIGDVNARHLAQATEAGAPLKDVADKYAGYMHRSAIPENTHGLQLGGRNKTILPVTSGANIARDPLFRDIPGGTERINDWVGRFAGNLQTDVAEAGIHHDLFNDLRAAGHPLTPELYSQFSEKATALAQRIAGMNPERLATPMQRGGLFSHDFVGDVAQRGMQHAKTIAHAKAAIGMIGDNARLLQQGDGLVPVPQVLKQLGLKTTRADVKAGTPIQGALVQAQKALAKQGAGKVDPFLMGKTKALRRSVGQYGITPEHLDQLTRQYNKWTAPEQIKSSLGAFDSITNAFKALAYPVWIPSHVRNAMTAFTNNLRHGVGPQEYAQQLKLMTGRGTADLSGVHPSLAGLAPADQLTRLRRMQFGSANIFGGHGMNEEVAGNLQHSLTSGQRITPFVPGSDRAGVHGNLAADTADLVLNQGLVSSLGATGKTVGNLVRDPMSLAPWNWGSGRASRAFSPLGIKGVNQAATDALPAVAAGRKAGTNIEDYMRGALWNKLVKGGHSPEMASDAINKLHFDYDALTGFEKNVARRGVPFYTFMKNNLPLQLETAIHTPGIINSQYKPFNQPEPGGKGYVPRYLNSGMAIPTGPEVDGKRQYISKLGLPAEEAFEKLHFNNGVPDVQATALDFMGQMNPLIKAPLEQLFDTQFHTQRRLSDLKAPQAASAIGRLWNDDNPQVLSQIMANSPLTRFVSSADKLLDTRKGLGQKLLNLGTGVRVTDVDTEKQRAIETRAALEDIMRGNPHLSRYSSFYVKPEDAQNLSPQDMELMRAYTMLQDRAKAFAKQKQERIGLRP